MKIDRDGAHELDRIPGTIRAGSELLLLLSLGRGAHPHCPVRGVRHAPPPSSRKKNCAACGERIVGALDRSISSVNNDVRSRGNGPSLPTTAGVWFQPQGPSAAPRLTQMIVTAGAQSLPP